MRFFVDYGSIEGFAPTYADVVDGVSGRRAAAARRVAARAHEAARRPRPRQRTTRTSRSTWHGSRDLRRGPLELVHPPLAPAVLRFDEAAFRTLWTALVQLAARRRADHAVPQPSTCGRRWSPAAARRRARVRAPRGLAGRAAAVRRRRPARGDRVHAAASRSSGRRARTEAGLKLRQPLRKVFVRGAPLLAVARRRDRRGAARQGGRVRRGPGRARRAAAEPAAARARGWARSCRRCGPR